MGPSRHHAEPRGPVPLSSPGLSSAWLAARGSFSGCALGENLTEDPCLLLLHKGVARA